MANPPVLSQIPDPSYKFNKSMLKMVGIIHYDNYNNNKKNDSKTIMIMTVNHGKIATIGVD